MNQKRSAAFNLGGKGWLIVVFGFLTYFLYSALMNDSLNVMIPALAARANLDPANLYLFSTPGTIVGILGTMAWGRLLKVKNARLTYTCSLILVAIFACVWGNANSYVLYGIGYLACYFAIVGTYAISLNTIVANWFPRKRGVVMGLVTAGFPLSAAFTSRITNAFAKAGNPTGFYYLVAGLMVALAVVIWFTLRDFPEEIGCYPDNDKNITREELNKEFAAGQEYLKNSKWTIKKFLTTGRTYHLWLAVGILGFIGMGIMTNFVPKFRSMGYEVPEILNMLLIAGLCAAGGSIVIGWLDTKLGTRKAASLTYILGIIGVLFLCLQVRVLHYCALPLFGISLGGATNFSLSLQTQIWGRWDTRTSIRVITPLSNILQGLGTAVVGFIGNRFNYQIVFWFVLGLAVVGFICLLTLNCNPIDAEAKR